MIIQQISVFVENRPGTLASVLEVLKEHEVNIRALSVADTADFGILRLIVNDPDKVKLFLSAAGFTVKSNPVLTITVEDDPGGLLRQVNRISAVGINIEYMYAFATGESKTARVVLKVDDLDKAAQVIGGEAPKATDSQKAANFYW